MELSNGLVIQYGSDVYPKISANSGSNSVLTLPTTMTSTNYIVLVSMLTDGSSTNYLRQLAIPLRTVTEATIRWYSSNVATKASGTYCFAVIGY